MLDALHFQYHRAAASLHVEQLACANRPLFLAYTYSITSSRRRDLYDHIFNNRDGVSLFARSTSQSMVDDAVKETVFALVRCASARPADA